MKLSSLVRAVLIEMTCSPADSTPNWTPDPGTWRPAGPLTGPELTGRLGAIQARIPRLIIPCHDLVVRSPSPSLKFVLRIQNPAAAAADSASVTP